MKTLQGFRTLIFNIIAVIAAWLAQNFDLPISVEHQVAIGTTIIAIGNITLRFFTKTPIGKKQEPKIQPKLVHELAQKQNANNPNNYSSNNYHSNNYSSDNQNIGKK